MTTHEHHQEQPEGHLRSGHGAHTVPHTSGGSLAAPDEDTGDGVETVAGVRTVTHSERCVRCALALAPSYSNGLCMACGQDQRRDIADFRATLAEFRATPYPRPPVEPLSVMIDAAWKVTPDAHPS